MIWMYVLRSRKRKFVSFLTQIAFLCCEHSSEKRTAVRAGKVLSQDVLVASLLFPSVLDKGRTADVSGGTEYGRGGHSPKATS